MFTNLVNIRIKRMYYMGKGDLFYTNTKFWFAFPFRLCSNDIFINSLVYESNVDEDRMVSITRATHRQREQEIEIGKTWVKVRSSLLGGNSLKLTENEAWAI